MKAPLFRFALVSFIPCTFVGLLFLTLIGEEFGPKIEVLTGLDFALALAVLATITGLVVGAASLGASLLNRRIPLLHIPASSRYPSHLGAIVTGFVYGSLCVAYVANELGILALTVIILFVIAVLLRRFARTLKHIFTPNKHASIAQASRLLIMYLNVLAAFTMLNASLDILSHYVPGMAPPFNLTGGKELIPDAFYFTVVVMTTLGFGDITPLTSGAKVLTALECMTGYFMFALLIGVLTRGISSDGR